MQPEPESTDKPQISQPATPPVAPVEPVNTPAAVGPVVTLAPEYPNTPPLQSPPTSLDDYDQPEPGLPDEQIYDSTPDINTGAQEPVRWQATEYIHRVKTPLWYIAFGLICVLLILLAIFVIQSITFAILIPVMAAALLVYSRRPPHIIDYTLSRQGLHVNDRLYSFKEFKSFGVIHGDDEYSVFLMPIKRFKPGVTVYFPEEAGEAIVDMLAARLPMQELHLDAIDRVIRKLRI